MIDSHPFAVRLIAAEYLADVDRNAAHLEAFNEQRRQRRHARRDALRAPWARLHGAQPTGSVPSFGDGRAWSETSS